MNTKRKMKHLVFANEVHIWVKSVYESEYQFLKKGGFLDQMKAFKVAYDSPSDAREYGKKLAQERIKSAKYTIDFMDDAIKTMD